MIFINLFKYDSVFSTFEIPAYFPASHSEILAQSVFPCESLQLLIDDTSYDSRRSRYNLDRSNWIFVSHLRIDLIHKNDEEAR